MGKNTSVALGDHFERFISEKVSDGRFNSASEVVRAGLRLLEDEESKISGLRQALSEGRDSGVVENFDMKTFLNKKKSNS